MRLKRLMVRYFTDREDYAPHPGPLPQGEGENPSGTGTSPLPQGEGENPSGTGPSYQGGRSIAPGHSPVRKTRGPAPGHPLSPREREKTRPAPGRPITIKEGKALRQAIPLSGKREDQRRNIPSPFRERVRVRVSVYRGNLRRQQLVHTADKLVRIFQRAALG